MPVPSVPQLNTNYQQNHERPIELAPKYSESSHPICSINELYTFSLTAASDLPFPDPFPHDNFSSEIPTMQRAEEKLDNEAEFKTMNSFDDLLQPPSYKNAVVLQQL